MADNKHLVFDQRLTIAQGLKSKHTFRQIAKDIGKDPSTISKEVRQHLHTEYTGPFGECHNACIKKRTCDKTSVCRSCIAKRKNKKCKTCSLCNKNCEEFVEYVCPKLSKAPYCCNGCEKKNFCSLTKKIYDPKDAQTAYEEVLVSSRVGLSFSEEEIDYLDNLITPLIRKGQSPHHICVTNADTIMVSERTIYNLIDSRIISAMNIDLPRKVRFSKRNNPKHAKVDRKCRDGRTYEDFIKFMEEHPDFLVVELDSVEGNKGGKVLLTVHFVKCELMLAFIRDHNDSASVTYIINCLYNKLGKELFGHIFNVCLGDNGSEFSNPSAIEFDGNGDRRTYVFYCDPSAPYQKGSAERNHEFIRRFIPKGKSMDNYTQEDIDIMMDNINSYARGSIGNRSPYEMFAFIYGQEALDLLGCHLIPPNEVTLNRSVFRKEEQA